MNIYDLKVKKRDGEEFSLDSLKGKVLLIRTRKHTGCDNCPYCNKCGG